MCVASGFFEVKNCFWHEFSVCSLYRYHYPIITFSPLGVFVFLAWKSCKYSEQVNGVEAEEVLVVAFTIKAGRNVKADGAV